MCLRAYVMLVLPFFFFCCCANELLVDASEAFQGVCVLSHELDIVFHLLCVRVSRIVVDLLCVCVCVCVCVCTCVCVCARVRRNYQASCALINTC